MHEFVIANDQHLYDALLFQSTNRTVPLKLLLNAPGVPRSTEACPEMRMYTCAEMRVYTCAV